MLGPGEQFRVPDHQQHVVVFHSASDPGRAVPAGKSRRENVEHQPQPKPLVRLIATERAQGTGRVGEHHPGIGRRVSLGVLDESRGDGPPRQAGQLQLSIRHRAGRHVEHNGLVAGRDADANRVGAQASVEPPGRGDGVDRPVVVHSHQGGETPAGRLLDPFPQPADMPAPVEASAHRSSGLGLAATQLHKAVALHLPEPQLGIGPEGTGEVATDFERHPGDQFARLQLRQVPACQGDAVRIVPMQVRLDQALGNPLGLFATHRMSLEQLRNKAADFVGVVIHGRSEAGGAVQFGRQPRQAARRGRVVARTAPICHAAGASLGHDAVAILPVVDRRVARCVISRCDPGRWSRSLATAREPDSSAVRPAGSEHRCDDWV